MSFEDKDNANILACTLCHLRVSKNEKESAIYQMEQHIMIHHIYELSELVTPATDGL